MNAQIPRDRFAHPQPFRSAQQANGKRSGVTRIISPASRWFAALSLIVTLLLTSQAHAASFQTRNFVVHAPTNELAREIGLAAEAFRIELADKWLGRTLPDWDEPCPVVAKVNPQYNAQGATNFLAGNGRAWGWEMEVIGSRERVLDSVLPHEITHTVLATHFGQRLPRWADEGACTTVEDVSERMKHDKLLIHFLKKGRGIALHQLFAIEEYPEDILPLYSQGYSLSRFLIEQKGQRAFVHFMELGIRRGDWLSAVREEFGYSSFTELQFTWMEWVKEGSPLLGGNRYQLKGESGEAGPAVVLASQQVDAAPRRTITVAPSGDRGRTVAVADGNGWYSRRHSELHQPDRKYATSHAGKAQTVNPLGAAAYGAPVRDASVVTIRR
jgi:hypothetical protein